MEGKGWRLTRIRIARTNEVRPGTMKVVEVNGGEILLANVAGRIYAMDNMCRHMGGSLGEGTLEGNVVTCPWHGCRWDVTSGRPITTQRLAFPLQVYDLDVEEGKIFLESRRRQRSVVLAGTSKSELERMADVRYTDESCVICGSRIDELGFCACSAGGI